MATLQKFKLLATQCTTAKSPSRKPTAPQKAPSASAATRRRQTLKKLLARPPSRGCGDSTGGDRTALAEESKRGLLRDLLLSSPPPSDGDRAAEIGGGFRRARAGPVRRGRRFGPVGFRHRMMVVRRTWRPVLGSIPE